MANIVMGNVYVGPAGRVVNAASGMMSVKFLTATVTATVLMVTAAVLRGIRVNSVRKVRESVLCISINIFLLEIFYSGLICFAWQD